MKLKINDRIKKQQGITLIALIITIIIMLILLTVSVTSTKDGKIFEMAKTAVDKVGDTAELEQNMVSGLIQGDCKHKWGEWQIIEVATCIKEGSKKRVCEKCEKIEIDSEPRAAHTYNESNVCTVCGENGPIVGDYIIYTPQEGVYKVGQASSGYGEVGSIQEFKTQVTDEEEGTTALEWRIFEITSDTISLMAATPTTQTISLKGANGYNNGVDILNDLCRDCYSNSTLSAEARSINEEDLYKKLNYAYTDFYTKFSRKRESKIK